MGNKRKIFVSEGAKYKMISVIKEIEPIRDKNSKPCRLLLCKCECGKIFKMYLHNFLSGKNFSCGCYHVKHLSIYKPGTIHGVSNHPLYTVWRCMNSRCYDVTNKSYKYYGGRGIFVCDEWRSDPVSFVEWGIKNGWQPGLRLDKDIKGGEVYSPGNCLFVTNSENQRHRKFGRLMC